MARPKSVSLLLLALALTMVVGDVAVAQQKQRPQGFFSRLFGLRDPSSDGGDGGGGFFFPPPDREVIFYDRPKPPRKIQRAPDVPAVVIAAKDPKARKILVVGDFVADGLAWGLDQELADEPKLAVIDRANNGSGLVRPDYYDWNASLLEILNQEKPDIIIMALGSNDRQQMKVGNQRLPIRSEGWEENYGKRVAALVETLRVYGRPFFWVGAPPVRNGSVSADMAYLNGLIKTRVEAAKGNFVDIWNGFANADGEYISAGPDTEGQVRSLRTGDGINFTKAGRRKLGFYVGRDLRRKMGVGPGAIDLAPSTTQESRIEIGPDGRKVLVGPIISLNDPPPATAELAGAPGAKPDAAPLNRPPVGPVGEAARAASADETLRFKVVVKGEALPVVGGRVDDFAWPPAPAERPAPLTWVPKPQRVSAAP